jgi:hypothetical protein
MLEVTGSGRARSFEDVRDHAIIRVFTEGRLPTRAKPHKQADGPLDWDGIIPVIQRHDASHPGLSLAFSSAGRAGRGRRPVRPRRTAPPPRSRRHGGATRARE